LLRRHEVDIKKQGCAIARGQLLNVEDHIAVVVDWKTPRAQPIHKEIDVIAVKCAGFGKRCDLRRLLMRVV